MRQFVIPVNFTILVTYSSLTLCLMIQNDNDFLKNPPQCSITVGNKTVDCELKIDDITDCCTEEQLSSPQHPYQLINKTAITFTVLLESIHMFYLSKGCRLSPSYCTAVLFNVPMELQVRGSEARVEISNLPDLYKRSKKGQKLILRKTNVLVSNWDAKTFQSVHAACDALYNTSMHQHVRSDSVVLVARPSPGLSDQLTAELIQYPCNVSCVAEEQRHCEGRVFQVKEWLHVNEPLLFNQLDPGSFYCVVVRYLDHLNCAIVLSNFEYRAPKELALSEQETPKQDIQVILGVCLLCMALSLVCGAILLGSFVHERGARFIRRLISRTANPTSFTTTLQVNSSRRHHPSTTESPPPPVLLLYSQDSVELCNCMKALAKVLALSTGAEVLDPLNDSWGIHTEKYRQAGLPHWLFSVLQRDCSVLLLMTPGGKMRESAINKLETVMFDPPKMLDELFLLGFDYIKLQKASDYKRVFQISFEGIGITGETYSVGVPLAKYILPLRLRQLISTLRRDTPRFGQQDSADETHHFFGYDKYSKTVKAFKKSLEDLNVLYAKNPQYTDRTLVSVNVYSGNG